MNDEIRITDEDAGQRWEFEEWVERFYAGLFRFAMSLAGNPHDAADFTQQTFYLLQVKGHQVRDRSKIKSWLYTTLFREFLKKRRHETRFPKIELGEAVCDLPPITADRVRHLDAAVLLEELQLMEVRYRAPLVLFYLKDHSYQEIAEMLGVPIGTVMSRLSRAKEQLRQQLRARRLVRLIEGNRKAVEQKDESRQGQTSVARLEMAFG